MKKMINIIIAMLLDVVALVALYLVSTVEPSLYWFINQPVVVITLFVGYVATSIHRIIDIIEILVNEHNENKSLHTKGVE